MRIFFSLLLGLFMTVAPWTPLRDVSWLPGLREYPVWVSIFGATLMTGSVIAHVLFRRLKRRANLGISYED